MFRKVVLIAVGIIFTCSLARAQSLLRKTVSVQMQRRPLVQVLNEISRQGNFHFSYTSDVVRNDSLVSLSVQHKTVKQALDQLFAGSCQYREMDNYVIILPVGGNKTYTVSGYVVSKVTGERLSNASVYERNQLISTLTNEQGYFRLKLKDREKYPMAVITVSKELFADTTLPISPGQDQEVSVAIGPARPIMLAPVTVNPVEKTWMAKFFLSSKQTMQSINLGDFFSRQPFQYSVLPGVGTHGRMDGQVVNKVSINVLGGYSAGLNGFEIAGLFNIDKKNVQYVQAAGIFNVVGGSVKGMQLAGIYNQVLDSVKGLQGGGLSNITLGSVTGAQLAGIYNQAAGVRGIQASGILGYSGGKVKGSQLSGIISHARDSLQGIQAGGLYNRAAMVRGAQLSGWINISAGDAAALQASGLHNNVRGAMKGVQLSGWSNYAGRGFRGMQTAGIVNMAGSGDGLQLAAFLNISRKEMRGAQIGLFNYTRSLKGVQIGLINVADTTSGLSIGLVNIIPKGYHRLALYSNEVMHFNAAYRTGNRKLYSIMLAGYNADSRAKAYSLGYGVGREFMFGNRLGLNTAVTIQYFYLGNWKQIPVLYRLQPDLYVRLGRKIALFAGPAFSIYLSDTSEVTPGYKSMIPATGSKFRIGNHSAGWLGWNAGITFF